MFWQQFSLLTFCIETAARIELQLLYVAGLIAYQVVAVHVIAEQQRNDI